MLQLPSPAAITALNLLPVWDHVFRFTCEIAFLAQITKTAPNYYLIDLHSIKKAITNEKKYKVVIKLQNLSEFTIKILY